MRVPGILEWPARVEAGSETETPVVTSDYLPTILSALGVDLRDERPLDGVDLSPLLHGEVAPREQAIGFHSGGRQAWIDGSYKLVKNGKDKPFGLYDLNNDPAESADLAAEHPQRVERMRGALERWRASCAVSAAGEDYR